MALLSGTNHVFILLSVLTVWETSRASAAFVHLKTSLNESFRTCQDVRPRPLTGNRLFPEPESRKAGAGTTDTEEGSSED